MREADAPDARRAARGPSDAPPARSLPATSATGPSSPGAPSFPELFTGAAVVALVPCTADLDTAAAMAWQCARVLARSGRRVALVDCHVDEPQLHTAAGEDNRDGIVDVFEYGASLSRIARQQPEPNLYFVPAGTFAPDPAVMAAHPRWRRLSAGFRHEDAVMLLFLPADCLVPLASVLDGVVALAPEGAEAGLASTPEIQAAEEAGGALLASLADDDLPAVPAARAGWPAATAEAAEEPVTAAPVAETAPGDDIEEELRRPHRSAWALRAGVYGFVGLLAAGVIAVTYRRQLGLGDLGIRALRAADAADSEPPMRIVPGYRTLAPHPVDTLPFAVQVSAWTSLVFALDAGDALQGRGLAPIVSPLRVGGRVWYRVYTGPVATRSAADSLLGAVRAAGLDRPRAATTALAPLSLALRRFAGAAAATEARARLRTAGIPAFVLGQADGTYRLYAGAYATSEQAAYLDSLLTSTGSAGQLGPRVGFRP